MTDHTNPAFVPDENGINRDNFPNCTKDAKNYTNSHTIELSNFNRPKDGLEDYDPYQNRNVDHPTTNTETLLHFLKGCLGTGILAMPKAFLHSGFAVGIAATVVIGILCTYSMHMLIRAEYELCKRQKVPSLTYHELATIAFENGPTQTRRFSPYAK